MTIQWNRDHGILSMRTGTRLRTGRSSTDADIAVSFAAPRCAYARIAHVGMGSYSS